MSRITKDQVEDLLVNVLHSPKIMPWKGDKIQFCCTVHGESHPSAGINIDFVPDGSNEHYAVFHCFSCGASGSLAWLLFKSLPDDFKSVQKAEDFLRDRYKVDFTTFDFDSSSINVSRYDDLFVDLSEKPKRFEMPKTKLALFKSGKETFQYFFDRGFDANDVKKFMIGRDLDSSTVTIPAFWEDKTLAGIIGRYINPNRPKNMRYKIYSFPKGALIYPLDKVEPKDNVLICVESMLDAIMLHKWGYTNAVAIMGNSMSTAQANQIAERCNKLVCLFDYDSGGEVALHTAKQKLSGRVLCLVPHYYPDTGKDPCEWGKEETIKVIESASLASRKLPRM